MTAAVVIGSGPNGLVSANILADAGWDVVVLEAAADPGGAMRSAEVAAPGYVSDLCSAFYPLAASPAPLSRLGLAEYGLRWRHAPTVLSHVEPDGTTVTMSRDVQATAESVERYADGDGARWVRMAREWQLIEGELLGALFAPFPPVRPTVRLLRRAGLGEAIRLGRRFVLPTGRLGTELFRGDGARLLVAGCAEHTDLTMSSALGGGYGWLLAMLGQHHGFPVPEGGAGALTAALVSRLQARGGQVVCGARVDRIQVRSGIARGVHTSDGRWWPARRAVLADVSAPALYRDLLEPSVVPARLLADLDGFEPDHATVKVDWALSRPVPWRDKGAAGSGTVHLGVDLAGLARYGAALAAGEIPADLFAIFGQMTLCDPGRSPAGTESCWAYTHLPQRDAWSADEVATVAARMEAAVEAQAPGFAACIVGRRVTGPAEFEQENANLIGGSLAGGTAAFHQQLMFRPVPGLGRADTVVDRLFLASAAAHPGGGVHGGPGANAARAALVRDRMVVGRWYAGAVRAAHRRIYPR
jgi:phytoene dehydrogenase-like protein